MGDSQMMLLGVLVAVALVVVAAGAFAVALMWKGLLGTGFVGDRPRLGCV